MDQSFRLSFEKVAMLAGIASMATRLGSKAGNMVLKGAKSVGNSVMNHPKATLGTAATTAFAGMEGMNVASKVNSHMNTLPKGTSMKSPSFYQRGAQ
jgi:hypothetical protein